MFPDREGEKEQAKEPWEEEIVRQEDNQVGTVPGSLAKVVSERGRTGWYPHHMLLVGPVRRGMGHGTEHWKGYWRP